MNRSLRVSASLVNKEPRNKTRQNISHAMCKADADYLVLQTAVMYVGAEMAADRELDFIKLKVDWYKSVFPWILAMVVGAVTFTNSIKLEHPVLRIVFALLLLSVIFFLFTLLCCWFASLALIHRLEEPYKTRSRLLNWFFSPPQGPRWETFYAALASVCLGAGLTAFVTAFIIYGIANSMITLKPKADTTSTSSSK